MEYRINIAEKKRKEEALKERKRKGRKGGTEENSKLWLTQKISHQLHQPETLYP